MAFQSDAFQTDAFQKGHALYSQAKSSQGELGTTRELSTIYSKAQEEETIQWQER